MNIADESKGDPRKTQGAKGEHTWRILIQLVRESNFRIKNLTPVEFVRMMEKKEEPVA